MKNSEAKKTVGLSQDYFEAIRHMGYKAEEEFFEGSYNSHRRAVDLLKVIIDDAKNCIKELEAGK